MPPCLPALAGSGSAAGEAEGAEGDAAVVGVLGVGAHGLVELAGVVADEDAPAVLAHAVEDDGGRLGGADVGALSRNMSPNIFIIERMASSSMRVDGHAALRMPGADVGQLARRSGSASPPWTRRLLLTISVPMWPGITTLALHVRRVEAEVLEQRLGEALHRELGRAVGGVRDAGAERSPRSRSRCWC